MAITDIPILSMLRTRMQWNQVRQEVLAENIANADTPNFQAHDLAEPEADVASQQLLAVLRDPHQVELDVKTRVGCATVVLHPYVILERVA